MSIQREKLWKALGYDPHPGQLEAHNSDARFKVMCCGRRFGKSTWAIEDAWPDFMKPNGNYWLCGPTYELGEREFEVLYSDVLKMPVIRDNKKTRMSYSPKAGNMSIRFPWNTVVKVVSAEKPKSLQGKGLDGVIMCEAGEHFEHTWLQYIRPALSDKRGWAKFPSTPKGFNWFYEYYRRGGDPKYEQWESWKFPSWANTHVFSGRDDPEILEAELTMGETMFKQEICAEFTAYQGRIYPDFNEDANVRHDIRYNPQWKNFWAFDFGMSNPTVCLDIQVDTWDNVYVWREYYERDKPAVIHAKALRNRQNPPGFKVSAMFGDPAAAGDIATFNLLLGNVIARKVAWEQGVEELKRLMIVRNDTGLPRLFISAECKNLIRELNTLRMRDGVFTGRNPREGQYPSDDHAADALRYFVNEYFILGAGKRLKEFYKRDKFAPGESGYFHYDTGPFVMESTRKLQKLPNYTSKRF